MKISPTAEVTKQAVEEASKIPWKHTFYGLEYWIWLAGGAAVIWGLSVFAAALWPRTVFEIGHEVERSGTRKERRKWVVVSVLLAIPLALLTRAFGTRLGI